jgi:phosphohistidine swiveling domain-containing protein
MAKWLPILRRKGVPVLFYSYINQGYKTEYYQELLGVPHGAEYHRYIDGWVVIEAEDSALFTSAFLPRLHEPAYVEFFLAQCAGVSNELIAFGDSIRTMNYATAEPARLLFDFMRFSSLSIRVMPFLNTMVFVQDELEHQLRTALSQHFNLAEATDALAGKMQALMLGGPAPLATQSIEAISALAKRIHAKYPTLEKQIRDDPDSIQEKDIKQQAPDLWRLFSEYLRNYDFLETDYYLGEPTTLTGLCNQISTLIMRSPDPADEDHDPIAIAADQAQMSGTHRKLLETAQTMQYLREYRLEALFKAGRDCRELLVRIGDILGVDYVELVHMTFDEIQHSLSSGALSIDFGTIAERVTGYASCVEAHVPRIVVGEELETLRGELPDAPPRTETLSGVTAFPGECTGTVRIIDHVSKASELLAGDILVTSMTLPYHVPAMGRAAAVLTDEGGILSHAAIVSRELRIPCIVGLGSATSTFSDGDRVQVRAAAAAGVVQRVSES